MQKVGIAATQVALVSEVSWYSYLYIRIIHHCKQNPWIPCGIIMYWATLGNENTKNRYTSFSHTHHLGRFIAVALWVFTRLLCSSITIFMTINITEDNWPLNWNIKGWQYKTFVTWWASHCHHQTCIIQNVYTHDLVRIATCLACDHSSGSGMNISLYSLIYGTWKTHH